MGNKFYIMRCHHFTCNKDSRSLVKISYFSNNNLKQCPRCGHACLINEGRAIIVCPYDGFTKIVTNNNFSKAKCDVCRKSCEISKQDLKKWRWLPYTV
jgi:hypothetical protein